MTASYRFVLTPAAKGTGVPFEDLRQAAVAAIAGYPRDDIAFKAFAVSGKRFALATRVMIEVDYFPNRVPNVTLVEVRVQATQVVWGRGGPPLVAVLPARLLALAVDGASWSHAQGQVPIGLRGVLAAWIEAVAVGVDNRQQAQG